MNKRHPITLRKVTTKNITSYFLGASIAEFAAIIITATNDTIMFINNGYGNKYGCQRRKFKTFVAAEKYVYAMFGKWLEKATQVIIKPEEIE